MIFVSSPMAVFIKGFGGETRRGMGMSFRPTPSPIHFVYRELEKSHFYLGVFIVYSSCLVCLIGIFIPQEPQRRQRLPLISPSSWTLPPQ